MRRVRAEQQELANKRAVVANKERKTKETEEKKRKNKAALPASHEKGTRLGKSNGFNSMQPWTQSSGGGGYKPAKRSVNRG